MAEEHPADPDERRTLAHRYLDTQLAEAYLASTEDVAPNMTTFRLALEHWWSQDQAKRSM